MVRGRRNPFRRRRRISGRLFTPTDLNRYTSNGIPLEILGLGTDVGDTRIATFGRFGSIELRVTNQSTESTTWAVTDRSFLNRFATTRYVRFEQVHKPDSLDAAFTVGCDDYGRRGHDVHADFVWKVRPALDVARAMLAFSLDEPHSVSAVIAPKSLPPNPVSTQEVEVGDSWEVDFGDVGSITQTVAHHDDASTTWSFDDRSMLSEIVTLTEATKLVEESDTGRRVTLTVRGSFHTPSSTSVGRGDFIDARSLAHALYRMLQAFLAQFELSENADGLDEHS